MVNYQYIASSILVPLIVSFIVCVVVLGRVYVNQLQPLLDQAEVNNAAIESAVKKAMTAMGEKSATVRGDKALEKMVAGDLLDQFPEVDMILGLVSPTTREAILENPEQAFRLLERYQGLLEFLPGAQGKKLEKISDYDLG